MISDKILNFNVIFNININNKKFYLHLALL